MARAAAGALDLPAPWKAVEDPGSPNEWYYWNQETGETSWEPPRAVAKAKATGEHKKKEEGAGSTPVATVVQEMDEQAKSVEKAQKGVTAKRKGKAKAKVKAIKAIKAEASADAKTRSKKEKAPSTDRTVHTLVLLHPELRRAPLEDVEASLAFLQEELQPAFDPWLKAVERDVQLLLTPRKELDEALAWLEEFLWNSDWAVGTGRQALCNAVVHCPRLLHQGADELDRTADWLEEHGVSDETVRGFLDNSPTAVPFPMEPFPWLALLQLGADGLEGAAAWAERELDMTREQVGIKLCKEPQFILACATANGAYREPPYPGYPLPVPHSTWPPDLSQMAIDDQLVESV